MYPKTTLRLLLLEDNPVEKKLLQESLQSGPDISIDIYPASDPRTALQQIKRMPFDLALVSASLSHTLCLTFLQTIYNETDAPPVILMLESPDPDFLSQATAIGVQDYLIKYEVDNHNLLSMIQHVVERAQLTKNGFGSSSPVKEGHDTLTGLPEQALFLESLEEELQHAQRYSQLLGLMFINIENLDGLYNHFGEQAIDALLKTYAEQLQNVLRTNDITARYSDNEFACILSDLSHEQDVNIVIDKVLNTLTKPLQIDNRVISTHVQLGVALYPKDASDPSTLLQCAYSALIESRKTSDNHFEVYSAKSSKNELEQFKITAAVRYALSKKQLRLRFQPVLSLDNQKITYSSAQLYWDHPEFHEFSSKDFLFLAEMGGLIWPVAEWLILKACEQYQSWQQQGLSPAKIRIELPSSLFRKKDFPDMVQAILTETAMPAEALELTLPVSALIQEQKKAGMSIIQLDSMGIHVLLDNFGASRTSLEILKAYPIKGMVIDDKIIRKITVHTESRSLVKTIIAMCQALRLEITANGVETREQENLLRNWHCPSVQGTLYSRAVSPDAFPSLSFSPNQPPVNKVSQRPSKPVDKQQRVRECLEYINALPPMPNTTHQLFTLQNDPDLTVEQLTHVLQQDPAISSQIIRYANAPFFGNQGKIKTLEQAVMTALGLTGAIDMALGITILGNVHAKNKHAHTDIFSFWQHAIYAATLCQKIAEKNPQTQIVPGTAYLVGLLQNIGYLVLCENFPDEMQLIRKQQRYHPEKNLTDIEKQIIGISHDEIGYRLLTSWHLPEEITVAIYEHHNDAYIGKYASHANLVLIANRLLAPQHIGDETVSYLSPAMLQLLDITETKLSIIINDLLQHRDDLDAMSKHLAA
ncbi:MAG: HDOD domain-containing protein [Gammaproteobacteria bacterium]|nr:HDOD domain-containing protein [Gammaproteobacteria bacterium]